MVLLLQEEKECPELGGYTSGSEAADGDVADWGDWNEATTMTVTCLFCDTQCDQWDIAIQHLKQEHKFDFHLVVGQLDFYQKVFKKEVIILLYKFCLHQIPNFTFNISFLQVKLVNYIRNQVDNKTCIVCEEKFVNGADLLYHMEKDNHYRLPDRDLWDRAE